MLSDAWNQLSTSSKHGLNWAGALARYRAEQNGLNTSSALVDTFDLLVGMLLEHPSDSEPKVLLEHFKFVPGQLLPEDYPRVAPEAIERHLLAVEPDSFPPLDSETDLVVEQGISLGLSTGSGRVAELRALFATMLDTGNPVSNALNELLLQRGTNLSNVYQATREYVEQYDKQSSEEAYSSFLKSRFSYDSSPVDIPNYKTDHGQPAVAANDLVGISAEVDAFSYLLASRGLKPPLAVGLFGDWGSGKSFFMESVRNRIERLTSDTQLVNKRQSEVPFWKRIIQIEFNAWHYVEGELWASLVDHIFSQLRVQGDSDDLVIQRRKHWSEKLDQNREKLAQLETERNDAERDLQLKRRQRERVRRERDSEIVNLEHKRGQASTTMLIEDSLEATQKALKPFVISIGVPTPEEVFEKLDEARTELSRGTSLINTLWSAREERKVILGSLVLIPVLVWVLSMIDTSSVTAVFGGISATLAGGLALLGRATRLVRSRLDAVDEAYGKVDKEIQDARKKFDEEVEQAEQRIADADERLLTISEEQQSIARNLKDIQSELGKVTPTRVLTDFVASRVGSGDYRKHLGVPALIQEDFRQLARLVNRQNQEILDSKSDQLENNSNCFNRIILYIDDLDRCPDKHVIEVLQAVHLLLAFDLFVVVVAVDSHWLSHALTKHYEALGISRADGRQATPNDYLEKIFQIPFWIQPLDTSAKQKIVQGLLRSHLVAQAGQAYVDVDGSKPKLGDAQIKVLAALGPETAPPTLEAVALTITGEELQFLDELAVLLGSTPRSTKRYVNLYQLVRIIYRLDPTEVTPDNPPEYQLLAFVLALGEGLPSVGPEVLKASLNADVSASLEDLLTQTNLSANGGEIERLKSWLSTRNDWKTIKADRIAEVFHRIDRFLFRIGGIA